MLLMELTLGHLEKELQSNIGQFCKELSRGDSGRLSCPRKALDDFVI